MEQTETTSSTTKEVSGARAIVIGGTGAIGKHLVKELLESPTWSKVTAIVRKKADFGEHSKLEQIVVDMNNLDAHKEAFANHDTAFSCLGTTRKDAGSAEAFKKVDLEYVTNFAKLSKDAGIPHFQHVTSQGSNKNSWFLYPQTKGQAEENVNAFNFTTTVVWRPGLLDRGEQARGVEKAAMFILSGMPVATVGRAMRIRAEEILGASNNSSKPQILFDGEIRKIASKK